MAHQILFKPQAQRDLRKLPKSVAQRIAVAIDALANQPRPPGCKKLTGPDDFWRIRIGDYRVIYQIFDRELVVLVIRVGNRRDVYD